MVVQGKLHLSTSSTYCGKLMDCKAASGAGSPLVWTAKSVQFKSRAARWWWEDRRWGALGSMH